MNWTQQDIDLDINDDFYAQLESQKNKRLAKQERKLKKQQLYKELKENLQKISDPIDLSTKNKEKQEDSIKKFPCFVQTQQQANIWPKGSRKWALAILGAQEEENTDLLKKQYLERAKAWHPDKHPNETKEAHGAMIALNEAWDIILR